MAIIIVGNVGMESRSGICTWRELVYIEHHSHLHDGFFLLDLKSFEEFRNKVSSVGLRLTEMSKGNMC